MRRRTLLAGLPLLALASEAFAHPPRQPDSAEAKKFIQEVTDFRAKLAKAVRAKDLAALRALYADGFTHTTETGKLETRDARLAAAMAGEPMIEAAPASDLVFRVFTGPTVIVTGTSPILNVADQKTYDVRWVSVYVTAKDGWELAVSQATQLA
ncbi:nuclear transport factor 2 family protein [uncultured Reyranella sp.]|uniref:nuclear transport factor 2 family protein n=1 Tax=uncultured Reyranella sp. TaxID=735512 RepID=UPI0025EAD3B6|nr:nuclear transport factor 2 family protein [uncultured Reyranella sp.]